MFIYVYKFCLSNYLFSSDAFYFHCGKSSRYPFSLILSTHPHVTVLRILTVSDSATCYSLNTLH